MVRYFVFLLQHVTCKGARENENDVGTVFAHDPSVKRGVPLPGGFSRDLSVRGWGKDFFCDVGGCSADFVACVAPSASVQLTRL